MNDDTLLLYYFDDGLSTGERHEVESALRADAALAARYDALCRELDRVGDAEVAAVPGHFLARWHEAVEKAARRERPVRRRRLVFLLPSLLAAAAVAGAFAMGLGIGFRHGGDAPPVPPAVAATGGDVSQAVPAVFVRGMQTYLLDARRELTTMQADPAGAKSQLIGQLLAQNRMFELAAERNDAQDLARVLRAFEPILVQLAADDIAPEDAESLRRQLSFELNVMLTKLSSGTSKDATTI
jgi:anti-sigma factor RsiW